MGMLAECFEELGGVPKVVLADRMGCLKAGVVANVVVPTRTTSASPATTGFGPTSARPLTGSRKGWWRTSSASYAKSDLMVPLIGSSLIGMAGDLSEMAGRDRAAAAWCAELNAAVHSEICAVPVERLSVEQPLLGELPSLRAEFGARPTSRKVDKLSCIRYASGRYSVPNRLIGRTVTVLVDTEVLQVI